jgi:thiol-disulfide isomerase/thioredoxin
MSKSVLKVLVIFAGIVLGILHYELKPSIDQKAVNEYAQSMTSSIGWRGQIAPDFTLQTALDEQFRLSDNVGKKIIVLNFFATWCGPCRDEMPELNRYFEQHSASSLLLVGIDANEKQDAVNQFIKDMKIDFPTGIDNGAIQQKYGVNSYPTTVLIGVDGKVQFYEVGELANADVAFDSLLNKNRQLKEAGQVISAADYRLQASRQPSLPASETGNDGANGDSPKLNERGMRIANQMTCPCGCDDNVKTCTCDTSSKVKKALASEDFKSKSDEEIIRELNKRYCVGAK